MLSFIVHSRCLDTSPSVNTMNRSPNFMKKFSHSTAKNSLNHTHPPPPHCFWPQIVPHRKHTAKLKCLFDTDAEFTDKWGVTHTSDVTHTLTVLKDIPGYNIFHKKINMFVYYTYINTVPLAYNDMKETEYFLLL